MRSRFAARPVQPINAPGHCNRVFHRSIGESLAYGVLTAGLGGYIDFLACW